MKGVYLMVNKTNKIFVLACIALLITTVSAYAETIDSIIKRAQKGDADAQCALGACYIQGHLVSQSYKEGVKWLRKSATQGYTDASYFLGDAYYNGTLGLKKNYTEAFKYLSYAGNKGNPYAQLLLGYMYRNGKGVKKIFLKHSNSF